jgi:DNA-binding XRE family transcriptional regulator
MNNLKTIRETAGLTQLELARKINVTKASVSNYETGFRNPKLKIAQQIAIAMSDKGVIYSVDDIFPYKKAS